MLKYLRINKITSNKKINRNNLTKLLISTLALKRKEQY